MEQTHARHATTARHTNLVTSRSVGIGALAGLVGGIGMAMWHMLYSAGAGEGFWTPVNVCMAWFVYRSEGQMMIDESMKHPGMMSMNGPVVASHILVGGMLHMMFSAMVGIAFVIVLTFVARTGSPGSCGDTSATWRRRWRAEPSCSA